jgi:hypothetical protein
MQLHEHLLIYAVYNTRNRIVTVRCDVMEAW